MKKLPTAEEFRKGKNNYEDPILFVNRMMVEFAKLHVEAQAKAIIQKQSDTLEDGNDFGSSEIMNAYSLTNIK